MPRNGMRWTRAVACSAAVLGALVGAPAAQAQLRIDPCQNPRGAECGTLQVPLDHTGGVPGTLTQSFVRLPATGTSRGTVVFLAGGPGEAATPAVRELVAGPLSGLRRDYDLVFPDQRGTGASSPLRCTPFPNGRLGDASGVSVAELAGRVHRCSAELGRSRALFTSKQTAHDLELLRRSLGVARIIPLGVSYGGQVAGEYARRFPAATQALVLDSTTPLDGLDALAKLPQLALPRVLRELCAPNGCSALYRDPNRQLAQLAARLAEDPLRGRYVTAGGRTRTASLDVQDVYALVRLSDVDPFLRTELPAAILAGSAGDAAPLLRLLRRAEREGDLPGTRQNDVRYLATACAEGRLPWSPESDPDVRLPVLETALTAESEAYAPFPVTAVAPLLPAVQCLGWAPVPAPEPVAAPGPEVPVLILSGREDLRSPLEDQRRAALRYPDARVLAVPDTGHVALVRDTTGCAQRALVAFLGGREVRNCTRRPRRPPLALPIPRRLSQLPFKRGIPARASRTLVAVQITLLDAERQAAAAVASAPADATTVRTGGLRGGTLQVTANGLRLRSYEFVTGVRLTGRLNSRGAGTLRVTGRGATGTVRITSSGRIRAVLDGIPLRLVG